MLALDTDKDGEISAEEIKNAEDALKKLDTNNNGKVDRQELRPQFAGPGGPPMGGPRRGMRPGQGRPRPGGAGTPSGEGSSLPKTDEEKNSDRMRSLIRRKGYAEDEGSDLFLVSFRVDKLLGLTGSGKCPVGMRNEN